MITACNSPNPADEYFALELADNSLKGIELNLIAEVAALQAGLSPGQVRAGLGGSRMVFEQIDAFLSILGHRAYFLEPLTYASAWLFERRGFAYVHGHKLMDDIQHEFQTGGVLYKSLDEASAFLKRYQAHTVRGRAWAIHDGILESLNLRWDKIRMVKQIGRHAGVETFPKAVN